METFLKRILLFFSLVVCIGGITFAVTHAPEFANHKRVENSQIAPKFDAKKYEGWAYAYNVLKRENTVLYTNKDQDHDKTHQDLNYPSAYLPDLIQDYGIAVQKPYSGDYVFMIQKNRMSDFYDNESALLLSANNKFRPITGNLNANDAEVIRALSAYQVLVDKMNTQTSKLTLEQAKDKPIGHYIKETVGDKAYANPIVYGQIAQDYLYKNLETYKSQFADYAQNHSSDPSVATTKSIMGITDDDSSNN